jgi:chromosome partitioning protein
MKTIAIASQKGGVGKSTLCLHLSVLAQERAPTLIVDLDPQGSATFWHSRRRAKAPILVRSTSSNLSAVLEAARGAGVVWTFIDTAPHDSRSMADAIKAADLVLIPARPSAFDLHAIDGTIDAVRTLRKPYQVVLTQSPPRRGFSESAAVLEAQRYLEEQGATASPVAITQRIISAYSVVFGLAAQEIEPDGLAAREYRALWRGIAGEPSLSEPLNTAAKTPSPVAA